jgi:hypothetical protein
MGEKLYNFSELSKQAKVTSIKDFSIFYVSCYRKCNMEILSQLPDQSMLWQINQEVYRNKYESLEHAAKDTIIYCSHSYKKLLNQLDMKYLANGSSEIPWINWYQKQYDMIPKGI